MEIVIKTILRQINTQCAGTQDIMKTLASCIQCGRKRGLKTVAFLLRFKYILMSNENAPPTKMNIFLTTKNFIFEIASYSTVAFRKLLICL